VNEFLNTHSDEIQKILAKYPPENRRSAIMPLLYLAQRERNYITKQAIMDIASILEISTTEVVSVAGYYTLYHDHPGGRYRLQVCTDLPCALRGADEFLHRLCENIGVKVGETTPDGMVTIEEVTCLAGCHRAPMFQLQGDGDISYHENQTVEEAVALVQELRRHGKDTPDEVSA